MFSPKKYTSDKSKEMKRNRYINLIFILIFQLFALNAVAEMNGPGDPGGGPTTGDPPLGGSAPINGGLIMVVMAAVYGGKKVYDLREKKH